MLKFDERLCLDQLLKSLAYQKLLVEFSRRVEKRKAERPAKSTLLKLLNDAYLDLTSYYNELSCHEDERGLKDSLGVLVDEACAEYVLLYLKQAKDEIGMNICNLNPRLTKTTLKKSLKYLIDAETKLDFLKEIEVN